MQTWNISEFNTLSNYTMVDGLTPEIIKRKYIWLLNALVENAIVGEDEYGLVWYSGIWHAGEWEDGTWYSGIWEDGEWKNGKFYSYRFDLKQLLIRNRRILEKDNPVYSQFLHGIWRRGEFYNGYFGSEGFYDNWNSKPKIERFFHDTRWEGGVFYNGIFRNSTWWTGKFQGGIFYNSEWFDQFPGKSIFSNGTFQGNTWWDGNFTGGDFVFGDWLTGTFNQANPNIRSRFGSMPITGVTTMADVSVVWHDGSFINGEFHSGLNLLSGFTQVSDNHNRTHWLKGTWYNGSWYGGTHESGNFNNGYWFEGYWLNGFFNNGYWINGFWEDGVINDGFFIQGLFKYATVYGGQLGYQSDYLQHRTEASLTFPPKFLGTLPTVITDTNMIILTTSTLTSGGDVLYDGGEIVTKRGVCWSDLEYPNIISNYNGFTIDGNGVGGFVSNITDLSTNVLYYIRAYATNALGTAYGNQVEIEIISITTTTAPVTTTTTIIPGTTTTTAPTTTTTTTEAIPLVYGYLYNFYALTNIAPSGWHVPTNDEWYALSLYLDPSAVRIRGGSESEIAGGPLKATGTAYWDSPNAGATNSTGFNARGGGYRDGDTGDFSLLKWSTTFASQTETGYTNNAYWYRSLFSGSAVVYSNYSTKNFGYSVRLIKDDSINTGSVIIDGISYSTVMIGTQVWMSENLAATHYNDSSPITEIINGAAWMSDTTGAYCTYVI